ncbi:hypothetical protein FXB40_44785 [Bradyrhizobium rifense]|uniref:Uncharacterized protein n=1 Tax=Bradyrhizobium rifense TaxID=515499 RepID=A0A5D3JZB4_9BRAD|nr:hypothetical protein [Bradyrhizobium rifense]TYL84519.1 hypothetical protein FXB40_44785 [Bradyrhizobium rifense]
MNFGRGFFRVWIILSALFAMGVAVVSYQDVKEEFEKASLDFSQVGTLMLPVDCREARGKSGADYTAPDRPWNTYTATPNCWYKLPDFRRLYPEYRDRSETALSDKLYSKAGIVLSPARPWRALGMALAIALAVPLFVLIVGAALGWAFSGFRSKRA